MSLPNCLLYFIFNTMIFDALMRFCDGFLLLCSRAVLWMVVEEYKDKKKMMMMMMTMRRESKGWKVDLTDEWTR